MEIPESTCLLSGPLAQRGPLMASLERAGARLEPDQGSRGHAHGLPDDDASQGWIAVRHADVDHVVSFASRAGWALRLHWNTPYCRVCEGSGKANHGTSGLGTCLHCEGSGKTNRPPKSPEQQLREQLDDVTRRLAAIEGKG
jgi:hypothetical protein